MEPLPRKLFFAIKNPASSAGRIRRSCGPYCWPLRRTCSMLDFFLPGVCIQTHLLVRRRKPVRLRSAHLFRPVFASGKYSKFRNFVKYLWFIFSAYFCGFHLLLWIFTRTKNSGRVGSSLAFVVLEKFHLTQAPFCFFACLVWATEVFAFLLGDHFVAVFYFLDHALPCCANSHPPPRRVNTMPAVELLVSGDFLRDFLTRQGVAHGRRPNKIATAELHCLQAGPTAWAAPRL